MVTESALLMSMSDIAALAGVRRSVVTVWRSRAAHTDTPFPASVIREHGQEYFDAAQVGAWLAETQHGNNPDAAADAAAHAAPHAPGQTDDDTFPVVTALLTLRSLIGRPLSELSSEDLVDAADEQDPDDAMLYREVEQAGEILPRLARYVDDAVEAGYGEAAVFESLITERVKLARRDLGEAALSAPGLDLMSRTALALASTQSGDPVFVDLMGGSTDSLVAIAEDETVQNLSVITANDDSESSRLQRRRLTVHHIPHRTIDVQSDGSFELAGSVVHVIQLPDGDAGSSPVVMLAALDRTILQLDAGQLAVVMGPSAVLCDANLSHDADQVRSDLLRTGRVRAVVRLPVGLRPRKPQQAQAMWIVGDRRAQVELAERWTMVADLGNETLDRVAITDLVSDLVASLGDLATIRAHAFRFARLALTRTLLASRGSLVSAASGAGHHPRVRAAALAVRVEELLAALAEPALESDLARIAVEPVRPATTAATLSAAELVSAGHLRYLPGNRIDPGDTLEGAVAGPGTATGIRIIGPEEIRGERPLGARRIDRLRFAREYSAGRLTEPGDVVFCTAPRPAAIVDTEGSSVVAFPARILRINPSDPNGLLGEVVVADVAALPPAHKKWESWPLRQTDHRQRGGLAHVLTSIRLQQQQARERLARLEELSALLITGVTARSVTLTATPDLPALPKGTI